MLLLCEVVYYMKIIREPESIHDDTDNKIVDQVKHKSMHENLLPHGDEMRGKNMFRRKVLCGLQCFAPLYGYIPLV